MWGGVRKVWGSLRECGGCWVSVGKCGETCQVSVGKRCWVSVEDVGRGVG